MPTHRCPLMKRGRFGIRIVDLGPFIWRGRRMESLIALIDRRPGWNVGFVRGINNAGRSTRIAPVTACGMR